MKSFFERPEKCKACGGVCCLRSGCDYHPADFENMTFDYLKKRLDEKEISIVSLNSITKEGEKIKSNIVLYLRARNTRKDIVDLISKKTTCMMLTENGCKYSMDNRPTGGVLFIAMDDGCYQIYPPEEFVCDWLKHQEVLEKLIKHITNNSFEKEYNREVKVLMEELRQDAIDHKSGKRKLDAETLAVMQTLKIQGYIN